MDRSAMNPFSIKDTIRANGDDLPDDAYDAMNALRVRMDTLTNRQRVVIFQVLTDFFCQRCGVDQPPGDCRCDGVPR